MLVVAPPCVWVARGPTCFLPEGRILTFFDTLETSPGSWLDFLIAIPKDRL